MHNPVWNARKPLSRSKNFVSIPNYKNGVLSQSKWQASYCRKYMRLIDLAHLGQAQR